MKVPREIVLLRYPLDRLQVDAGFDRIGDGGVTHNLRSHALWVQACNDDCLAEWLVHTIPMPSKACAGARGRVCAAGGGSWAGSRSRLPEAAKPAPAAPGFGPAPHLLLEPLQIGAGGGENSLVLRQLA